MRNRRGFSLIELAVALGILVAILVALGPSLGIVGNRSSRLTTEDRFQALANALNKHFLFVMNLRAHTDWYSQSDCSRGRTWLVPAGCWTYTDKLVIYPDDSLLADFERAGCRLVHRGTGYDLQCLDGWNRPFHFSYQNADNTHSVPYDYTKGVSITITSAGPNGKFGDSDDLSFTWTSAPLDVKYGKGAHERLEEIAHALDGYFRRRFSYEVVYRLYPNGLSQEDDMRVNWYLQLCTNNPNAYCTDSSCSNINWSTPVCDGDTSRDTCSITTILRNLNLSPLLAKDPFGNPIHVNLCFDPDGDGCPNGHPPSSHDDCGNFASSVSNGIETVVSTGE